MAARPNFVYAPNLSICFISRKHSSFLINNNHFPPTHDPFPHPPRCSARAGHTRGSRRWISWLALHSWQQGPCRQVQSQRTQHTDRQQQLHIYFSKQKKKNSRIELDKSKRKKRVLVCTSTTSTAQLPRPLPARPYSRRKPQSSWLMMARISGLRLFRYIEPGEPIVTGKLRQGRLITVHGLLLATVLSPLLRRGSRPNVGRRRPPPLRNGPAADHPPLQRNLPACVQKGGWVEEAKAQDSGEALIACQPLLEAVTKSKKTLASPQESV